MQQEVEEGNLIIRDDDGMSRYVIPLEAIASWRTLLGLGSDVEAVAAIMQARDPGVLDPATSRNAWTSAYEQCERERLLDLNQEHRAARVRAMSPTGSLVSDGRMETRRLLGLSTVQTFTLAMVDETGQSDERTIPLPENIDADKLAELLAEPYTQTLIRQGETDFLAQFTPQQ